MEKKYQITSYQLVYASGGRDTVKLFMPVMVDDLEKYRNSIRATHDCIGVNLTYTCHESIYSSRRNACVL